MDEEKGWLKKILNDASEDVKTWPNWLRDPDSAHRSDKSSCSEQKSEVGGTDEAEGERDEKNRGGKRTLRATA